MTDELLRELDEDVRRERYEKLWRRYGNYVVALAIAIVGAAAGLQAWKQYQQRQQEALSERYVAALETAVEGDRAGAIRALAAIAAETSSGYAALARLQQAALMANQGDVRGALEIYDALSADTAMPRAMRDLAVALGALHATEREDVPALERRVASINVEGSPWRYAAREAIALAAVRTGDRAKARDLLRALADDLAAPAGVRGRATEILAALEA